MNHLHRTNINFHEADIEFLQERYGYGWTRLVRDIVHEWVVEQRRRAYAPKTQQPLKDLFR